MKIHALHKICLVLTFVCFASTSNASIVEDSKQLIKSSQFDQAYQMLTEEGVELDNSNNLQYNYNLGISALRSGKYSHAIFALKRVLYAKPKHAGAQLDLAIAYYHVGNLVFAEKELKRIKRMYSGQATSQINNTIDKYLQKIAKDNTKLHVSASSTLTIGETTNMNSGIEVESVDTVLGSITITEDSLKTPSDFSSLNTFIKVSYDARRDLILDTKISSSAMHYHENPDLDQSSTTMSFGLKKKQADIDFYANTSFSRVLLNNEEHLTNETLGIVITKSPSKFISNIASVSRNRVRFVNEIDQVGDIDKTVFGLEQTRAISKLNMAISTKILGGKVKALNDRPDGDDNFFGARMTVRKPIWKGLATLTAGIEKHEYDKINAMYGVIRDDKISTASFNYNFPFSKGKAVNIGASYSDQKSNIATNTTNKLTPSVGLAFSF